MRRRGLVSSVREVMDTKCSVPRALLLPGPSAQEVQRRSRGWRQEAGRHSEGLDAHACQADGWYVAGDIFPR